LNIIEKHHKYPYQQPLEQISKEAREGEGRDWKKKNLRQEIFNPN